MGPGGLRLAGGGLVVVVAAAIVIVIVIVSGGFVNFGFGVAGVPRGSSIVGLLLQ